MLVGCSLCACAADDQGVILAGDELDEVTTRANEEHEIRRARMLRRLADGGKATRFTIAA